MNLLVKAAVWILSTRAGKVAAQVTGAPLNSGHRPIGIADEGRQYVRSPVARGTRENSCFPPKSRQIQLCSLNDLETLRS